MPHSKLVAKLIGGRVISVVRFPKYMHITATNNHDLISKLKEINIEVPFRTQGRTTEHTERYSICYFLSTLAFTDILSMPLELEKNERPDFILSMKDSVIGIEQTEAVPQNEAAKDALRERGHGENVYFISPASVNEKRKKSKELIKEIKEDNPGCGWEGNQAENEWANVMLNFVFKKLKKLNSDGFTKYGKNWLLIYDNWPFPKTDLHLSSTKLSIMLQENMVFKSWQRIFIHSHEQLIDFTEANTALHKIKNIW